MKAAFAAGLLLASLTVLPAAAKVLTVAWRDKAPHHYVEDGVEKGVLLARARQIFSVAGVDSVFVREPAKRIWANFQSGITSYCSFGWYHLPEREEFAQFSLPIHVDPPHTVMIASDAVDAVSAHPNLASLLADHRLTLGLVDGVSYGAELDARIKNSANAQLRRTVDPIAMMRMVVAGRASFMFVDRDDLDFLRERDPSMAHVFQHDFADMPAGLKRYILCSKDVPAETMARLNKAIESVRKANAADARAGRKRP